MKTGALYTISLILVLVGALNWGLIGFFNFDIVSFLFGQMSIISRIVYALVGLGAIYVGYAGMTSEKSEQDRAGLKHKIN